MLWGSLCRGSGQLLSGGAPGRVRLPVFLVGVRFPGWFREAAGAGSDLDHVGIGEGPTTGSRERCPADAYRLLGDLHAACLFFAHPAVVGCLVAPTSAGCLRAWVWGGVLGLATVYTSPPSHSHAGLGTLVHDDGVCLLRAGWVRLLWSTALCLLRSEWVRLLLSTALRLMGMLGVGYRSCCTGYAAATLAIMFTPSVVHFLPRLLPTLGLNRGNPRFLSRRGGKRSAADPMCRGYELAGDPGICIPPRAAVIRHGSCTAGWHLEHWAFCWLGIDAHWLE